MEFFGTVKLFNPAGWGFINCDRNPRDLYFQKDNVKGNRTPNPGDRVSFTVKRTPKGLRAIRVKVLDATQATADNWHEFIGVKPIPRDEADPTA